jgi:hypothetical protein
VFSSLKLRPFRSQFLPVGNDPGDGFRPKRPGNLAAKNRCIRYGDKRIEMRPNDMNVRWIVILKEHPDSEPAEILERGHGNPRARIYGNFFRISTEKDVQMCHV